MFEKLLSLVPYNPSLTHQLAFYSRRMREEASIRRIGLVFLVLTFFVQFFAVLSPPQATLASGDNDMITGGISSAADAERICLSGAKGYSKIVHYFGLTCKAIGSAPDTCLHNGARNYYSMGWKPVGAIYNGKVTNDTPYAISGVGTLWARKMDIWNQPHDPTCGAGGGWHVLRLHNSDGREFYVMFDCGNLVSIGPPVPAGPQVISQAPETPSGTPFPVPTVVTPTAVSAPVLPPTSVSSTPQTSPTPTLPCSKSASASDTLSCVIVHKTAANITAGLSNADNTTANANDVIVYTLYAEDTGTVDVKDFIFQENLNDVLDYADATDFHGGTLDSSSGLVTWPTETLKAGETTTHQITVKVKATIPQTPPSTSDPTHFDLMMTNVYGNAINIKLPGSPAQVVQTTAASLPNTGPGTSLFIGAMIVMVGGYFYGRARLLAKESALAVQQNAAA